MRRKRRTVTVFTTNSQVQIIETKDSIKKLGDHRLRIGSTVLEFSPAEAIVAIIEPNLPPEAPAPEGSIQYLKERGHLVKTI